MTENTPEATNGPETTPPEDAPTEATFTVPEYKPTVPEGNEGSGRYAVYDLTLERYVSEVTDTKPSSKDAKALTHDGRFRIIEV